MSPGSVIGAFIFAILIQQTHAADRVFDGIKTDNCAFNPQTLIDRGIVYIYGITSNCVAFIFDVDDVETWEELMKDIAGANLAKSRCYGNDFTVDVQIDANTEAPVLFVMDKHHVVFHRERISTTLPFRIQIDFDYLLQMNEFEKRGSYDTYVKYAYAGGINANTFGLTTLHDSGFYISVGVRNKDDVVEHECLAAIPESLKYPPALINFLSEEDWRSKTVSQYLGKTTTNKKDDWYINRIKYLWIIAVCLSIIAIILVLLTGMGLNRTAKANVKLDVAIEALIASSCTNGEHQLKRSALLTKCGFPSVEVIDGQVPTGVSLQDDPNGYQSINEYDVLAEQIRRVQAAPEPGSSARNNLTGSDASASQK
uniref:Glycoprotein n=1 Tax=Panagrellus redivivus TaxID=6233 RepID=A0A7E4W483_PANRE